MAIKYKQKIGQGGVYRKSEQKQSPTKISSSNNKSGGSSSSSTYTRDGITYDKKTGYRLTEKEKEAGTILKKGEVAITQKAKEKILREDIGARKIEEQVEQESKSGKIQVSKTKDQIQERGSPERPEVYDYRKRIEQTRKIETRQLTPVEARVQQQRLQSRAGDYGTAIAQEQADKRAKESQAPIKMGFVPSLKTIVYGGTKLYTSSMTAQAESVIPFGLEPAIRTSVKLFKKDETSEQFKSKLEEDKGVSEMLQTSLEFGETKFKESPAIQRKLIEPAIKSQSTLKRIDERIEKVKTGDSAINQIGLNLNPLKKGTTKVINLAQTSIRTGQRFTETVAERPFKTTVVTTAGVVGAITLPGATAVSALSPTLVTGALSTGYAIKESTTGIGEDFVYGSTTPKGRELIREGLGKETRVAIKAESEQFSTIGQIARSVPFSELTKAGTKQDAFAQSIRQQQQGKGLTDEEVEERVKVATQLRKAKSIEAGSQLIAIEAVSELYGGPIKRGFTSYGQFSKARTKTGKYVLKRLPAYAQVGFAEGFTGTFIEKERFGEKASLREATIYGGIGAVTASSIGAVIDYTTIKSQDLIVPTMTKTKTAVVEGRTLRASKVLEDITYGTKTLPASKTARRTGRIVRGIAYVSDPAEAPGDILATGIEEAFDVVKTGRIRTPSISVSTTKI